MARRVTRRRFLKNAALGGAGLVILKNARSARAYAANDKPNVAMIGCGGRGNWFVENLPKCSNIVAMCDVNMKRAGKAFEANPDTPKFFDFRKMLDEKDREIDAVTVITPDHTHAIGSVWALKHGKHTFCEKGLTRTVYEAQLMRKLAEEKKLATQMGNQGSSCKNARRGMEVIQDGVIGDVKEVYSWDAFGGANRNEIPKGTQKIPDYLKWNLWLGYAAYREFHPRWMAWSQWREFGSGNVGMWGSHGGFIAWNGLNIRSLWDSDPKDKVRIKVAAKVPEINRLSFPKWSVVRYKVPARGKQPACDWYWIGGAHHAPGWQKRIEEAVKKKFAWADGDWGNHHGSVIVGTKGVVHAVASNFSFAFVEPDKFKHVNRHKLERYSLVKDQYNGHPADWLRASKDGKYTVSDFRNSGPYTEFLLLANIATQFDAEIEYDPVEGKITNNDEANALIRSERRGGWEL